MASTSLPMAMFYLFALSPNPTVLEGASLPPREAVLDPQIRNVAKILDAIVHFLPTTRGLVFALSLEVNETGVRIVVAGNTQEHFRTAFGQTPAQVIQYIWSAMRSIATSDDVQRGSHLKDLVTTLFKRHEGKLKQRFDKRKDQCGEFFKLAEDPDLWSSLSFNQQKLVSAAKNIFQYTSTFFDFSSEKRSKKYHLLHVRLQVARSAYDSYKKDLMTNMRWVRSLELKVQDNVKPSTPFDFIRYIDKLSSPSIHAARLYNTAREPFFQGIMCLPLTTDPVATNPPPSKPLNQPSEQEVRSFLAHCYGMYATEEEEVVSNVLDFNLAAILDKISKRPTLNILPPHCECNLIHHHHSHHNSSPYPYIAVSKLSCLNCALYAAACRKYGRMKVEKSGRKAEEEGENKEGEESENKDEEEGENKEGEESENKDEEEGENKEGEEGESNDAEGKDREGLIQFQTRGFRADVTPLLSLPTRLTTPNLDAFAAEDILNVVKGIVRVYLRDAVEAEKMRRLSPSTAGSMDSSPDILPSLDSDDEGDMPELPI